MKFFIFALILLATPAFAAPKSIEDASAQEIVGGMSHKLVRGVANVLTGSAEIPLQIISTTQAEGGFMGSTVGVFKGVGMFAVRTVLGGYDVVTFLIPFPWFYNSMIDPEYLWLPNDDLKGVN